MQRKERDGTQEFLYLLFYLRCQSPSLVPTRANTDERNLLAMNLFPEQIESNLRDGLSPTVDDYLQTLFKSLLISAAEKL